MNKIILALISILTSTHTLYSQCESLDIIRDPSFEIDAMNSIGGDCISTSNYSCVWQRNDGGQVTNTIAYDGNYSWVTNAGSATQDSISLAANTDYILSCWVNTPNADDYSISIGTFGRVSGTGPTNGWEKISLSFTTMEDNLSAVRLELACHIGQTYFDLFELCAFPALGLKEENLLHANSVYPNPSRDLINLDLTPLSTSKKIDIKVFNTEGRLVFQEIGVNPSVYQFQLNEQAGLYFMEITSEKHRQFLKLLKE